MQSILFCSVLKARSEEAERDSFRAITREAGASFVIRLESGLGTAKSHSAVLVVLVIILDREREAGPDINPNFLSSKKERSSLLIQKELHKSELRAIR